MLRARDAIDRDYTLPLDVPRLAAIVTATFGPAHDPTPVAPPA